MQYLLRPRYMQSHSRPHYLLPVTCSLNSSNCLLLAQKPLDICFTRTQSDESPYNDHSLFLSFHVKWSASLNYALLSLSFWAYGFSDRAQPRPVATIVFKLPHPGAAAFEFVINVANSHAIIGDVTFAVVKCSTLNRRRDQMSDRKACILWSKI
jgi:hypothetical protein